MRTLIISFILLMILGLNSFSQNTSDISDYIKYEDKYSKYFEYSDKYFPQIDLSTASEKDILLYKNEMEAYAKSHPSVPKKKITGDNEMDNKTYQAEIDAWYSSNSSFPRFIPYHFYHKNLTMQDDIQSYENAVKIWMEKNEKMINEIKN